jgi:hypothetical protein
LAEPVCEPKFKAVKIFALHLPHIALPFYAKCPLFAVLAQAEELLLIHLSV